MIVRFLVKLARFAESRFVNRRVKPLGRKFPATNYEFPRPVDRLLFEVIAEAPIAEHLEKSVMIGIQPDIFEVIMFAAGADAFLGVGHTRRSP